MEVRVSLVGGLRLTAGARPLDLSRLSRHDRLVLAYLTVERTRRITRDELAELVWEQHVPASWKTALRGVVSRIRAALDTVELPRDTLRTGPGWYELSLPPSTVVDVEAAAHRLAEAVSSLPEGRYAVARAAGGEALAVARQPFLPGVQAAWVDQRQQLLDELRLRALEVIADAALGAGDWAAALHAAEQAVMLAPLRESGYRRLAVAHAGAGNRGEALRTLAECRQTLAEELGADASPETEALSVGLLRGMPVSSLLSSPPTAAVTASPSLARGLPFVGRVGELAALAAAWGRACLGVAETVVVVGEAGAGKTRLLAEFAAGLDPERMTVLYGRCDYAGSAFGPLLDALRDHLPRSAVNTKPATVEAIRDALARLTAQGSTLLILDDLHWLDRESLALLQTVLRGPDRRPLLLAGTYRTGDGAATAPLAGLLTGLRRERPLTRIDLAGLPADAVGELVRSCVGPPPSATATAVIADATAGNPLFVRELVRLLDEEGRLDLIDGQLSLVDGSALTVPDGVREVILARCHHLSPGARRVLAAAAVCGREVDVATLEALAELSTVDVMAAVEEAAASGLIVERAAVAGRFGFVHGLVQEALYRELSAVRRQRLHADVATALEQGPGPAAGPPRVAYHLLRGGPEVADRAVAAATRAGADANRRHAYDEAVGHYRAALALAGPNPAVRCRLRLEVADAQWRAGETVTARQDYDLAATEALEAGRPDLAARAVFGGAANGPTLGRCNHAVADRIAEVLKLVDPRDSRRPRLLVRLATELAGVTGTAGAARAASAAGAGRMAGVAGVAGSGRMAGMAGVAGSGRMADAAEMAEMASTAGLAGAAGVGDPLAAQLCAEALELADEFGDQSTVAYVLNGENWVSLGDPADRCGLDRADRVVGLAEVIGDRHMLLEGRLWRCTHLLRAGRIAEAEHETAALTELAIALRQPFYLRMPLRLRACLALLHDEPAEATALAAEAYAIERRVQPDDAEVHALLHAAAVASQTGHWPEIGSALDELPDADSPHWTVIRALQIAADGHPAAAARLLGPVLPTLGSGPLSAFAAALLTRACERDERLASAVDITALGSVLEPWQGNLIVAGCTVAVLRPTMPRR